MSRVRFLAFLLVACVSAAQASDDGWFQAARTRDGNDIYSIKLGSGERSKNKAGEPMTVVVGQKLDKKTSQVTINKWYVTDSDCAQGYGTIVILKIDGTFDFEAPFAKGGQSVGSGIADVICNVFEKARTEDDGKGI